MLFNNCESCEEIAEHTCGCEDPPHYFCGSHTTNHIRSSGIHSVQAAIESLSASEVSSIQDAYNSYRLSSLRQAVQARNSRIESLLLKIRRAEEECSSIIETILTGQIAKDIEQVLFYRVLPVFSNSSVVQSLLDLKHTSDSLDFSSPSIHEILISLNSSLHSFVLSSFPSSFSTQHFPSQIDITKQIDPTDPTNYRWELLKQTKAHQFPIYSIAVSDCERYIASASQDKTIKIWDLQTLALHRTLEAHTHWVLSVAFLGNKVVSGSADMTIKIWEEYRCVKTLNKHSDWVLCMSISSCKRLIVSGGGDSTAVVFRSEDNETLHTLRHSHPVPSVAFSPDNKEIISGSFDGKMCIWNTDKGQLLKTFTPNSGAVTCAKFLEQFIAASFVDKTVKFWDKDNDRPLYTFNDHTDMVCAIDVRDNVVASLGSDNSLIIRDIRKDSVIQTFEANGSTSWGKVGLRVLEGGKFIASGAGDGNLNVWRRLN